MKNSDKPFKYEGNELELFKNASNWKSYYSDKIKEFIKGDVLEVGAGIGANTKFLYSASSEVSSWCFVEPDKLLSEKITSNIKDLSIPMPNIVNGTIKNVESQEFDTILYIDVIEHIKNSEEEIARAISMLRNQGKLIILVPAYNFLFSDFDKQVGHFRRYNKIMIRSELNNKSGKILKLFYLDSMGFVASLFNKYFLKKSLPSKSNIYFWDNILIRISKIVDLFTLHKFGKSLICIYKNEK